MPVVSLPDDHGEWVSFSRISKHCHAGACDGRRPGVGEEVRTAPLPKQIYDLFAGAGESAAGSAEGFTEVTGDEYRLCPVLPQYSDQFPASGPFTTKLGQRLHGCSSTITSVWNSSAQIRKMPFRSAMIPVHGENAVRSDEF